MAFAHATQGRVALMVLGIRLAAFFRLFFGQAGHER